jgi:TonB family protein
MQSISDDTNPFNEPFSLSLAVGLHLLLLLWNPLMMVFHPADVLRLPEENSRVITLWTGSPVQEIPPAAVPVSFHRRPMTPSPVGTPLTKPTAATPVPQTLPSKTFFHLPAFSLPARSEDFASPETHQAIALPENVHASIETPAISLHPKNAVAIHGGGLQDRTDKAVLLGVLSPRAIETGNDRVQSALGRLSASADDGMQGPASDLKILRRIAPIYPEWAEEQGVSGLTQLFFSVLPDGRVSADVRVAKTSGNPALDTLAVEALRQWRFAALPGGVRSEWGVVSFHFSLKG